MLSKIISTTKLRTWIEIDVSALENNYCVFRRLLGSQVKLLAVVKSNAYGHGLVGTAKIFEKLGADFIGVDSITEALRLRAEGITTEILVLGYTRPENFLAARRANIILTVVNRESLAWLEKNKIRLIGRPPLRVHLKVDTGMHRQGFLPEEFPAALDVLRRLSGVAKVEGIYSHLAAPGARKFTRATKKQIAEFGNFLKRLNVADFNSQKLVKHLVATGGAFNYPAARFDLARIGLGLYGLWPSRELEKKFARRYKLRPALVWKTIISEVKIISRPGGVGYDLTEKIYAGERLAVCPIGYWHGFPRALSSVGRVAVKDKLVKVVGRVSMDMIVLNVSAIKNIQVGDEVILIGPGAPASAVADLAGTSPYEIITRLNPLIKKFYL